MTDRTLRTADEIKRQALMDEIYLLLGECTVTQRGFFTTLHRSLGDLSEAKLVSAYNLVVRTIKKNQSQRAAVGTPEQQAHWAGYPEKDGGE
jgi:hypothetical protein